MLLLTDGREKAIELGDGQIIQPWEPWPVEEGCQECYESVYYDTTAVKIGSTVNIRMPQRWPVIKHG